ncbi:MAG: hypothetical protein WCI18_17245 [Pseudomonadota bacterium]
MKYMKESILLFLALISLIPRALFAGTFSEIEVKIKDYERLNPGQTLTIPQVLTELPLDLRSNFTLFKKSDSLQEASPGSPRVLLFGIDGKTMITYNGDKKQHGFNSLEFVEINESTSALEFREIIFPEEDSNLGKVDFSTVNPEKCMACHGPIPHYIWSSYDKWPNAFGSVDDILEMTPDEARALKELKSKREHHPRYSHLDFFNEKENPSSPFRPVGKSGIPDLKNRGSFDIAIEYRPNFRLGFLMSKHQARARVYQWKNSPGFEALKSKVAHQLAGCTDTANKDLESTLSALGRNMEDDLTFTRRGKTESLGFRPGVASYANALQNFMWLDLIGSDSTLKSSYHPYSFTEVVKLSKEYSFAVSSRGIQQWQALDDITLIAGNFPGAEEADYFADEVKLIQKSKEALGNLCASLKSRFP